MTFANKSCNGTQSLRKAIKSKKKGVPENMEVFLGVNQKIELNLMISAMEASDAPKNTSLNSFCSVETNDPVEDGCIVCFTDKNRSEKAIKREKHT